MSTTTPPGLASDSTKTALVRSPIARGDRRRVRGIDEGGRPAEPGERVAELGQRPAVQLARRDDVIARLQERVEREQLGGVAGRRSHGGPPALERRDPLLERGHGRVGDARVDVAERLEVEQGGRVVDVLEDVGGRLVDRHVARSGDRVGSCAGVDGPRLEAVGLVDLEGRPRLVAAVVGHPSGRARRLDRSPVLIPLQASSPLSRPYSIFMQRSSMKVRPASPAIAAPSGLRMPSWSHRTFAPIAGRRVRDLRHLLRAPEDVHDVHGHGDGVEVRVDRLAQDRRVERARIDRDDPVALALEVAHHEVARPVPVRGGADHGDGLRLGVDAPEERVRIDARRARDRAGDEGAPVGRVSHAPTIARRDAGCLAEAPA